MAKGKLNKVYNIEINYDNFCYTKEDGKIRYMGYNYELKEIKINE